MNLKVMFISSLHFPLTMDAILFGFGPFSKYKENPSKIIVEKMDGKIISGLRIKGILLPVTYSEVKDIIKREIVSRKPNLALGIGLAPGRNKITLEKIAINYEYSSIPDTSGMKGTGKRIDPDGPDGIFTNLNVEKIVRKLNEEKIPADISLSAGGYICNLAMYAIMQNSIKLGIKGGFVHIPCHRELVASDMELNCPYMEIGTIIKGIKIILKNFNL